jgi:DNA replication and repair protein RecF
MIIKSLRLKNFRNLEEEELFFHDRINVITGQNAQGKTNLIEAINLLSLAKSFRTRKEDEMIMLGKDFFSVKGVFERKNRELSVEIIKVRGESGIKCTVNGIERASIEDFLGEVYTVVFSPEDLQIVKGGPERRRNFLDRELILTKPLYYSKLKKYRRILRTKNAYLKNPNAEREMLAVYDETLAEAGIAVMEERAYFVERLSEAGAKTERKIAGNKEKLDLSYEPDIAMPVGTDRKEAKKIFLEKQRASAERDRLNKYTNRGPHKDDIKITANGLDLRVFGSQGQQRTAAVSVKLAEEDLIKKETGERAIVLLDDVMSELDEKRQTRILKGFEKNQIFVSAAEINSNALKSLSQGKIYSIRGGHAKRPKTL